jgi:hypothetical protein
MTIYLNMDSAHGFAFGVLVAIFIALVALSFAGALFFTACSTASIVNRRICRHWKACFVICSAALGGWMALYAGQLRFGGGVMFDTGNIILLWFLILAVVISAILAFNGRSRHIVLGTIALSLVGFDVAVPGVIYSLSWLIQHK